MAIEAARVLQAADRFSNSSVTIVETCPSGGGLERQAR